MFRKHYFTLVLTIALLLVGSMAVVAQTGLPVGGQVVLKTEDGKVTPVADALVEVFRIDIKTKLPSDKTDKKGYFKFAGLPFGQTFALSISGPGISPEIIPNVKAGMENLMIDVRPGDGKVWTEAEVRTAIANMANPTKSTQESSEDKKKREELEKQRAEIENKNKKAMETNKIVAEAMQVGNKAFETKDYNTAIAKYEEGYNADQNFIGSAPAFLNNKAAALINRGAESYNKSVPKDVDPSAKAAFREDARKDFEEAVTASERALEVLKAANSSDMNQQKAIDAEKLRALVNRKNAFRVMAQTGVNIERGKDALPAYQEYMAAETDPVKKTKAQLDLAMTLQDSAEFELAIIEFEKVLAEDPNNVDALVGIGLSTMTVGYGKVESGDASGKAQLQEAANYLQKFVDLAPDNHRFKKDMIDTLADMKKQQNVTPQKTNTKTTTTKKKN